MSSTGRSFNFSSLPLEGNAMGFACACVPNPTEPVFGKMGVVSYGFPNWNLQLPSHRFADNTVSNWLGSVSISPYLLFQYFPNPDKFVFCNSSIQLLYLAVWKDKCFEDMDQLENIIRCSHHHPRPPSLLYRWVPWPGRPRCVVLLCRAHIHTNPHRRRHVKNPTCLEAPLLVRTALQILGVGTHNRWRIHLYGKSPQLVVCIYSHSRISLDTTDYF